MSGFINADAHCVSVGSSVCPLIIPARPIKSLHNSGLNVLFANAVAHGKFPRQSQQAAGLYVPHHPAGADRSRDDPAQINNRSNSAFLHPSWNHFFILDQSEPFCSCVDAEVMLQRRIVSGQVLPELVHAPVPMPMNCVLGKCSDQNREFSHKVPERKDIAGLQAYGIEVDFMTGLGRLQGHGPYRK